MRNTITLFSIVLLLIGCSSIKRNQKFLARGDYNEAIELAVKKLQKDKNSEKNQAHIGFLKEAYQKAVDEDTRRITFLKKENNPETSREIYNIYRDLQYRQDLIRPLLPLYNSSKGESASFKFIDYSNEIITSKINFATYLFEDANALLNQNTIADARGAFEMLTELKSLQPNYSNIDNLLDEAHFLGTDFVFVSLSNHTGQIIPRQLELELLDFNTYGLDDFWTEYHNQRQRDINYNYGITLNFKAIEISPERISEKEIKRNARIKTGWEYQKDRSGNIIKDSLGNPIKYDILENVSATLLVSKQTKSVLVGGDVIYRDLIKNRNINSYPLASEFIFENTYASYRGEKGTDPTRYFIIE